MANKTMQDIIKGFGDAMGAAINQRSLVTQVCEITKDVFGTQIPDVKQQKEIAEGVAEEKGWQGRSADSRKSEVRAVLRSHDVLDEMCGAIIDDKRNDGSFTWHNAIKAARIVNRLRKAGTYSKKAVVAAYYESKPAPAPQDQALSKLRAFVNVSTRAKHFKAMQDMVSKYAAENGIDLS